MRLSFLSKDSYKKLFHSILSNNKPLFVFPFFVVVFSFITKKKKKKKKKTGGGECIYCYRLNKVKQHFGDVTDNGVGGTG